MGTQVGVITGAINAQNFTTELQWSAVAGRTAGDVAVMFWTYNSAATDSAPPTGWTRLGSATKGTNTCTAYSKVLTGAETGAITMGLSSLVKQSVVITVSRGYSGVGASASLADPVNDTTHDFPTVVANAAGGAIILGLGEKSSTISTTTTPPSGYTTAAQAVVTGGGASLTVAAYKGSAGTYDAATANGATVNPGVTTNNQIGEVITWTVYLTPTATANAAPVANAGADQSNVEPYTTVTLTGSGTDSDGSIATYAWAQLSGTTAALSGSGATRTLEAPGTIAGSTLVFQLTVTDNSGATGTDTVQVVVLPVTERAVIGGAEVPMKVLAVST